MIFYVTFGQQDHRKNNYYKFEAESYEGVLKFCDTIDYMRGYSMIYKEDEFEEKYFPNGILKKISLMYSSIGPQAMVAEIDNIEILSDRHIIRVL